MMKKDSGLAIWLGVVILILLPFSQAYGQDPSCLDAADGTPANAACVVDDGEVLDGSPVVYEFFNVTTGIRVEGGNGDNDRSGSADIEDVVRLVEYMQGETSFSTEEYAMADMDGDGRVTYDDLGILAAMFIEGYSKDQAVQLVESAYGMSSSNVFLVEPGVEVGIGTTSPQATLDVNGSLNVDGPIYQRGQNLHADYVFKSGYELETIEEHAELMWREKHLGAVPGRQLDAEGREILELGAHRRGLLEELEKAHVYIAQLNEKLTRQEAELAALRATMTRLAAAVDGSP